MKQSPSIASSGPQAFSIAIPLSHVSLCLLSTASGEKKEGWSWEAYLEEQKAITAPVSLFQDVSGTASA